MDTARFPVGTFVAVYIDRYRDEIPTIGRVIKEIPGISHSVKVEWWYGKYRISLISPRADYQTVRGLIEGANCSRARPIYFKCGQCLFIMEHARLISIIPQPLSV